jgi:hypothetical protein
MLLVVGIIHLLPLSGFVSSDRLTVLYGIPFDDQNLEILMRHRATLFGLLGAFLCFAAFQPAFQVMAFIAGFVSVLSFLYLSWSVGDYNAQLARVYAVDIVALACLVVGAGLKAYLLWVNGDPR